MSEVNELKSRQPGTRWSLKEFAAFQSAGLDTMGEEDFREQFEPMRDYYGAPLPRLRKYWGKPVDSSDDFRRRDLLTLLNNWGGEVDRAGEFVAWQRRFELARDAGRLGDNKKSDGTVRDGMIDGIRIN